MSETEEAPPGAASSSPPAAPSGALGAALRRIAPNLEQVERAMRDQLPSGQQMILLVGEHVLASGGKRLRPALVMLSSELCGYDGPRRVQVAAALELVHTATLLHDDVVDLADTRRGQAAARTIWGNRRAVLVGDYFYSRSSAMIVEDGDIEVLQIFSDAIARMAEGELMQLEKSFDPDVTEAHYYGVVERKSAALIASAAEIGSVLGGVTRAERRRLAEYGRELGIAFQLRDDSLDYTAGADVLGKAPYTDLREGKVTLPLLLTLKRCNTTEREQIARVLKQASQRALELEAEGLRAPDAVLSELEVGPVLELIRRHRGIEDTDRRALEHVARASAAIAPFPDGPARDALLSAAAYAAERES